MVRIPSLPFLCRTILLPMKSTLSHSIIRSCNVCLTQHLSTSVDPPKKPLNPYLRFLHNVLPELNIKFPNIGYRDKMKMAGNLWKSLDIGQKKKFLDMYYEECEKYNLLKLKHESKMSTHIAIVEESEDPELMSKEKRKLKKLRKLSGRPKRPPTAFLLYLSSKRETFTKGKQAPHTVKSLKIDYQNLTDEEKMKYTSQSKKLFDAYKIAVSNWEEKVIKLGCTDVLRKRSQFHKASTNTRGS